MSQVIQPAPVLPVRGEDTLARHYRSIAPDWNKRPMRLADFRSLAMHTNAFVIYDSSEHMIFSGIYTNVEGLPVIIVDPRLRGMHKRLTYFHELGHHVSGHNVGLCFAGRDVYDRAQAEADFFAANAIRPGSLTLREAQQNRRGGKGMEYAVARLKRLAREGRAH
jgi:Zn-dependent peptidase ImmA (M78 family)